MPINPGSHFPSKVQPFSCPWKSLFLFWAVPSSEGGTPLTPLTCIWAICWGQQCVVVILVFSSISVFLSHRWYHYSGSYIENIPFQRIVTFLLKIIIASLYIEQNPQKWFLDFFFSVFPFFSLWSLSTDPLPPPPPQIFLYHHHLLIGFFGSVVLYATLIISFGSHKLMSPHWAHFY